MFTSLRSTSFANRVFCVSTRVLGQLPARWVLGGRGNGQKTLSFGAQSVDSPTGRKKPKVYPGGSQQNGLTVGNQLRSKPDRAPVGGAGIPRLLHRGKGDLGRGRDALGPKTYMAIRRPAPQGLGAKSTRRGDSDRREQRAKPD